MIYVYLSCEDVQENHVCFHLRLFYDSQLLSIIETGYIPYVTRFWSIPDLYTVTILFLYFPSLNKGKKCEVWFVLITNIIDWSVTALWLKARNADFGWVLHNALRSRISWIERGFAIAYLTKKVYGIPDIIWET